MSDERRRIDEKTMARLHSQLATGNSAAFALPPPHLLHSAIMNDPDLPTLMEARAKAEQLLLEVQRLAADAEANPPPIPPEDLATGKQAMASAVAAAERTLRAIEDALRCVLEDQTGHN